MLPVYIALLEPTQVTHVIVFFSISRTIPDPGSQKLNWHKAPLTVLVVKKIYDESILDPFKEVIAWLIEVVLMITAHAMHRSSGGDRGSRPPLQNHQNLGFLSNTGPDCLKNHKATKPEFNVGPSSARQQNAI